MDRKVTLTGVNLVFLTFVILFIMFQVILMVLTRIYGEGFLDSNIYFVLLVNEYILILIPVLVYSFAKRLNFKEVFRLNPPGILPSVLIVLLSLPAYTIALALNNIVVYYLQFIGDVPAQTVPVPSNVPELIQGLAIIAFSPAICEELLHRGLLLEAYESKGSYKAIIITSIFFGIFHFDITNLLGPIFLGMLIGYYVIRTNSIFAGMLAHFLNNGIAELFSYFFDDAMQPEKLTITSQQIEGIITLGIIGCAVLAILIYLFKLATEGKYEMKPAVGSIRKDITAIVFNVPVMAVSVIYLFMTCLYILSIV
jgi:membrane protease YdiL (CAAX protease family)